MKKFICLTAFGLLAWFVASPAPAAAGSWGIGGIGRIGGIGGFGGYIGRPRALILGWGRYDWSWYRPVYRRGWRVDYYYPYAAPSYTSYTAYYPQEQSVDANAVTLRMQVPSDARIWVEDAAMSQSGADHTFVSPPLAPGYEYTYHIRVQWDEDGKAVERSREVKVHAGDRINLTINK